MEEIGIKDVSAAKTLSAAGIAVISPTLHYIGLLLGLRLRLCYLVYIMNYMY
jgi:hypothetical protein